MSSYEHRDVVDTPQTRTSAVARSRSFSPGQLLTGAVGVVLLLMGIVAVTRTGIDGSLNTPPTDIFGLAHSALIGLVEIVAGLLLLVSSASIAARPFAGFVGVVLVIGGIVVAASTGKLLLDLGTEQATGWFLAIMGGIALLGAMVPTFIRSDREVTSERYVDHPVA